MVYRRRTYRKKRKTTYATGARTKKRFRRPNTGNKISVKVGNPWPRSIVTKNNWCENAFYLEQTAVGTPNYFSALRLNSAYDPNLNPALGQESVQYHSIYRRYYDQYIVQYVTIEMQVRNQGNSDCRILAGIADDQNMVQNMTVGPVSTAEAEMQSNVQTKILEGDQGSRYNRGKMYFKFSVTAWNKRMQRALNSQSALVNASPTIYPILWVGIDSEGTNTAKVNIDFKASFTTRYFDRQQAAIMKAQ